MTTTDPNLPDMSMDSAPLTGRDYAQAMFDLARQIKAMSDEGAEVLTGEHAAVQATLASLGVELAETILNAADSAGPAATNDVVAAIEAEGATVEVELDTAELKRPEEWEPIVGVQIVDPDGWRKDGKPFDEPITRREFEERAAPSTVRPIAIQAKGSEIIGRHPGAPVEVADVDARRDVDAHRGHALDVPCPYCSVHAPVHGDANVERVRCAGCGRGLLVTWTASAVAVIVEEP